MDRRKVLRYGLLGLAAWLMLLLSPGFLPFHPKTARGAEVVQTVAPAVSASSLLLEGRQAYKAGNYPDALRLWQHAVDQLQSSPEHALALSYVALAQQKLGHLDAAFTSLDQAQASLNQQTEPIPDILLGQIANTRGSLLHAQGQTQAALEAWEQAEALYIGDVKRQLGVMLNQAQAQQDLGFFLLARQRLEMAQQRLAEVSADDPLQVLGRLMVGKSLYQLGDFPASQQVLMEALELAQQHPVWHHSVLLNLGNNMRAQGKTDAALDYYRQASTQASTSLEIIQADLNRLSLLSEMGDTGSASRLTQSLRKALKELPLERSTLYARIQLGAIALSPTSYLSTTDIATDLQAIIQDARQISDSRAEAYGLGYLGHLYEIHQQWADAQALTQSALDKAQRLNTLDIVYQWQWQLGRIQLATDYQDLALQSYQGAFQSLKELRSDLAAINPDQQFSFRESVEPLYRELVDLLLKSADGNNAQARLTSARDVMEALQLAELSDFFRSACLEGQIVPVEQITSDAVAVIYPVILPGRLAVIASIPGQPLRQYSTSVTPAEVENTVNLLLRRLRHPFTHPQGKLLGTKVYDWLIRPIAAELSASDIKTLTFVLDGPLRNVPMAALHDGEQYLIEQYSLALTPGLQLLSPRPLAETRLGTLAAGLTEARHGFSALTNVADEITEIESSLPSRVLLDQDFTVSEFQSLAQDLTAPIIHLATHGQFSSKADDTFVLAWDRPINVNELSSILRTGEQTRSEPIELLVLSACQTAIGDQRAVLGLAGIAVQAGARSTVASLWNVFDQSTAVFMSQFYQALSTPNISKAEALRQAQLALLNDPDYRHPIHWAAFVLVGNWL